MQIWPVLHGEGKSSTRKQTVLISIFTRRNEESDPLQKDKLNKSENGDNDSFSLSPVAAAASLAGADMLTESSIEASDSLDIYSIGCIARVVQVSEANSNQNFQYSLLVEGIARARIDMLLQTEPYLTGRLSKLDNYTVADDVEVKALAMNLKEEVQSLLDTIKARDAPAIPKSKVFQDAMGKSSPGVLADVIISNLDAGCSNKQRVLESLDLADRLRLVLHLTHTQVEMLTVSNAIHNQVQDKLSDSRREFYLRQQLKAIQAELGEGSDDENEDEADEIAELENRVAEARLPQAAQKCAATELKRIKRMSPQQPEYSVLRTYLEWMADLPWSKTTRDRLDIEAAQHQLDSDHYGLEKVKKRIVQYLAVRSLKQDMRGPIICLVGPPGVGKTSLGRSVANALGREFQRLSLGGVHDEAEIRGHRRTYIGAMPGTVVQALKRAGTNNPVILLDEVDKLGRDVRGDPASALLEVLDPAQNNTFVDHYLNTPFDLSSVLFIATANDDSTIPGPLLDRMEVIRLPGYTHEEKLNIAQRYLVPRQMTEHGLTDADVELPDSTVQRLATDYTREAGVRSLERKIASVCRHAAVCVVEWRSQHKTEVAVDDEIDDEERLEDGDDINDVEQYNGPPFPRMVVDADMLEEVLGPKMFDKDVAMTEGHVGVATGMAWTPVGGEILFIECSRYHGNGGLQLTGQLGDVMVESCRLAMSWIRANWSTIEAIVPYWDDVQHAISDNIVTCASSDDELQERRLPFDGMDVHVHFPAGAVPKDGPSAGVAITLALVSLVTGMCVRPSLAVTGEISLQGLVLPVGGIKEKVIAAHRAGITTVVLPERNSCDAAELPESVTDDLQIVFATNLADVLAIAFESPPPTDCDGREDNDRYHAGSADAVQASRQRTTEGVDLCGPIFVSML